LFYNNNYSWFSTFTFIMKKHLAALLALVLLTACSGIPLRSVPQLLSLPAQLLDLNPAEFMLAIQVDARMTPPPGAAPSVHIAFKPAEPGAFEAIDRRLPMRFSTSLGGNHKLAPAGAGRQWLVYSFPPESQTELVTMQTTFKRVKAERQGKAGGSLTLSIDQEGVAVEDPTFQRTRWESWLQVSQKNGFFELWSGTVATLLKQAKTAEAAGAQKK
jgi:hypothetical protein